MILDNNCLWQDVQYLNLWNSTWNADTMYREYMEQYDVFGENKAKECKRVHRLYYELVIEPILELEWAIVNILQHFNLTFWVWSGQALDIQRQTPIHPWEKGK